MRHVQIFCLFVFYSFGLNAQNSSNSTNNLNFQSGNQLISLSIGTISTTEYSFGLFGFNGSGDPSPSLNLSYEYGITDQIAIGAFFSYYRVNSVYQDDIGDILSDLGESNVEDILSDIDCILFGNCPSSRVTERVNASVIGGSLSYHKEVIDKLDTYVITYLGYAFNKRKTITESALDQFVQELDLATEVPKIVYFGGVGARLFLSEQFAVYGELGQGNLHLLKLGATYRF